MIKQEVCLNSNYINDEVLKSVDKKKRRTIFGTVEKIDSDFSLESVSRNLKSEKPDFKDKVSLIESNRNEKLNESKQIH